MDSQSLYSPIKNKRLGAIENSSPVRKTKEETNSPAIQKPTAEEISNKRGYTRSIHEFKSFGLGKYELLCCRFDQEDTSLATASSDGIINIYSLTEPDKPTTMISAAQLPGMPITSLRWRPNISVKKKQSVLVSTCADGSVSHWHPGTGKLLHRINEKDNQVLCLDYNRTGQQFATAGKDRTIRVYDELSKTPITEMSGGVWQYPGHSNRIFALKYHPKDSNVIVSAGWDNMLYFWDVRDKKSFGSISGPSISGDAIDIKGNVLLTGSWRNNNQLELWDMISRKKIQNVDWEHGRSIETAQVYTCQFSKKDAETILAGCSTRNEVKVFDRESDNRPFGKIGNMQKGIYSVDFANTYDAFAFCGGDGFVHVYQMDKTPVGN